MRKIFDDDYSEADYIRDEHERQQRPGLFSNSPLWFRHSEYELFVKGFDVFIKPKHASTIEYYKPFKLFESILGDFITLALNLRDIERDENYRSKKGIEVIGDVEVIDDTEGISDDERRSMLLTGFIEQYGPLGLFWDEVSQAYFEEQGEGIDLTIVPHLQPPMVYDDYAEGFFPSLRRAYPCLEKTKKQTNRFFNNYSESVQGILENDTFRSLVEHISRWDDFTSGRYKPEDKHPKHNTSWEKVLSISFSRIKLGFGFEAKDWQLSWRFNSLLQAISIMHFMNVTGKMGDGVRVCELDGCNKPVLGRRRIKFCSTKHGQNKRRRKHYKIHGK